MESKSSIDLDVRSKHIKLCKSYLRGQWCLAEESDVTIQTLNNGLDNNGLYCCLIKNDENKSNGVVIKFFNVNLIASDPIKPIISHVVCGEKEIGPKVLGLIDGGIMMKYYPWRNYHYQDDKNSKIVTTIAKKLAKMHSLNVPLMKDNRSSMSLNLWFNQDVISKRIKENLHEINSLNATPLLNINLSTEINWIESLMVASGSPLMFTHNDFHCNNILIQDEPLEVKFIDLDYACYFYRGIDLGRYFSLWGIEDFFGWTGILPTHEEMSVFLNAYIEESTLLIGESFKSNPINSLEHLIKEVKIFTLFCYLIDVVYCLCFKGKEFIKSANQRLIGYLEIKDRFTDVYNDCLKAQKQTL